MPAGQKEYSDRLFNFIFGSEDHRDWTLSLYNAVNKTQYDDPSVIEFTTIRETLYLGMHNDVSFLIAELLNLYEQQSTFNPNMPVRLLQYTGNMYEQLIAKNKRNKYGKTLIALPVPKLVVFYNGVDEKPEEMELRLTDAFPPEMKDVSDIEVRVRMINVNQGKNRALLEACKPLGEYSWIVNTIREYEKALPDADDRLETAIDKAIDAMPDEFIIKPFLEAHRAEVKGMLLTEYNEAKTMELFKEEGRIEGKVEGIELATSLIRKLLDLGRTEDVARVTVDPVYRDKLLAEFRLA